MAVLLLVLLFVVYVVALVCVCVFANGSVPPVAKCLPGISCCAGAATLAICGSGMTGSAVRMLASSESDGTLVTTQAGCIYQIVSAVHDRTGTSSSAFACLDRSMLC